MTTAYKPQATADQARTSYRNVTAQLGLLGLDTSIPEGVRAVAEKAVAQTREAYDRSKDVLDASVATFERTFEAAGQGATAFNRKIIELAQRNLNSVFDLSKSLAGAKDLAEIVEVRAAYWQKQLSALTVQAEEVRALFDQGRHRVAAAEPIEPIKAHVTKAHVTNGMDELRNKRNEARAR